MKIFVPMPDENMNDRRGIIGRVVPFSPEFLLKSEKVQQGRKPSNWISDNDYSAACARLRVNDRVTHLVKNGAFATA
jgi:hypothetical protein